jgi:TolB-like protein
VISKDELIEAVWEGRIVSDSALTTRLNEARTAIGDTGEDQRLIKTLARKGVRFVGPVREQPASRTPAPSDAKAQPEATRQTEAAGKALSVPDKPSVAVLPFANMSGDPEQEYFADGVVEDITTALSRFPGLFVIARNSSFTYKGRASDVRQIGAELGVRYVLEGSVRKHAKRVRITGQLINATSGVHLWADRFEGELEDIFELQDRVTTGVVGAIAPKIEQAEIERAKLKNPESLRAYDYYLRGRASFHQYTEAGVADALDLFRVAIRSDPAFAAAYGMAAMCYALRKINGWSEDRDREATETAKLASRAIELGKDDAVALSSAGYARARALGDLDGAVPILEQALMLNPNMAQAWYAAGYIKIFCGEAQVGLDDLQRAMRLSPVDPLMFLMHSGVGFAHFILGDYDQAAAWAERALREKPDYRPALRVAAASHALAGRPREARAAMEHLRALNPDLRGSQLKELVPFRRPQDYAQYEDGLRKAGLPD